MKVLQWRSALTMKFKFWAFISSLQSLALGDITYLLYEWYTLLGRSLISLSGWWNCSLTRFKWIPSDLIPCHETETKSLGNTFFYNWYRILIINILVTVVFILALKQLLLPCFLLIYPAGIYFFKFNNGNTRRMPLLLNLSRFHTFIVDFQQLNASWVICSG